MSDRQYFIGLCIDVRTCKFIPLEFIQYHLDYVLMYMFMSAMYCVCINIFHLAHICMVLYIIINLEKYHSTVQPCRKTCI